MNHTLQHQFFERIKQKLDPHLSLVNEIADVLEVSNDSAYRRLRGETAISLDEAAALAGHFGIALPEFSPPSHDAVLFGRSTFREQATDFDIYLEKTERYLKPFAEAKTKQGYYAAKDVPIFYFFQFPELAQFKLFFWLKTMRDNVAIKAVKFDFNIIPQELLKKAGAIARLYFSIPTIELWHEDTVNAVLRQISYFSEAGWSANKEVSLTLCDKVIELFQLLQRQAETGSKWWVNQPVKPEVPWEFYYNELTVLDNNILLESDEGQLFMIGYNALDYLFTSHAGFCNEGKQYFLRQMSKSLKISGTAEKERNRFFNKMYSKIEEVRSKIKNS